MAIVSCVFLADGTMVVMSADSKAGVNTDEEQERYLHQHLSKLRDIKVLTNSHIILIVENNFGGPVLASRIAHICSDFSPLSAMTRDTNSKLKRAGVTTTGPVKERMRVELQRLLRSNTIRFAKEFFGLEAGTRDMLTDQLRKYHFQVIEKKGEGGDPTKKPKIVLTGKGGGSNDDLAMTVQLLCFWVPEYWADGKACLMTS